MDATTVAAARTALADPQVTSHDLAQIAAAQPALWVEIAGHPQAYPGLLDWMERLGPESVRQAVAARRAAQAPYVAADHPSSGPTSPPGGSGYPSSGPTYLPATPTYPPGGQPYAAAPVAAWATTVAYPGGAWTGPGYPPTNLPYPPTGPTYPPTGPVHYPPGATPYPYPDAPSQPGFGPWPTLSLAKALRRDIGQGAGVATAHLATMNLAAIILAMGLGMQAMVTVLGNMTDPEAIGDLGQSTLNAMGWVMCASAVAGACWWLLLRGKRLVTTDLTTTVPARGRFPLLATLAVAFFAAQAINLGLIWLQEAAGAEPSATADAVAATTSPGWAIYLIVVAPCVEELAFRGALLRHLAPYGANFAIVTQALIFGLFHGNVQQGLFTFMIGLVLGYVALRFSLKWSLLLHMVNNAFAVGMLVSPVVSIALVVLSTSCLVATGVLLVLRRDWVRTLLAEGRSELPQPFRTGWSHPGFIVLIAVLGLLAVGTSLVLYLA